ncbi:hypothetical protein FLAN108750_09570 [Flavobacterium antarcticum]|uniref:hypothetical protein n=1 Tax=Flavobacterium antarcticum TaxID=271155 RepID=UPI0003B376DF|nr:hypothetical protein [Flavobacterium antarcticum]
MKKTIIILSLITLPLLGMAQSKISAETSFGNFNIGKDYGANVEVGVTYHFSEQTALKLSGLGGQLENRPTNIDYQVLKFALHSEQKIISSKQIEFCLLFGISYLSVENNLPLEKNDFTGIDLGTTINIFPKSKWGLGVKIVSTYAYDAPGGILQANGFVSYRF